MNIAYDIKRGDSVLYSGFLSGQRNEAVMGVDVVTVTFSLTHYIDFLKGDTMYVGEDLFILSKPSDFEREGKWTYNLQFLSESYKLADAEMLGLDENNELTEYECYLTGTADKVVDFIIANANKDNPGLWIKGTVDETETFDFDFTGDNCTNALVKLTERSKIEFWIENKTINLTKKGADSGLSFAHGKGKGLVKLTRKTLDTKPVTRLRVYGSKQNLPTNYPGISKRLRMPGGQMFIQDQAKVDKYGLIPDTILFEDIFPRRTGTITSIVDTFTFIDSAIDFNVNEQLINKVSAKVKFITGQLAGYTLEIKEGGFNNTTKAVTIIVNKDERSMEVPSATGLKAAVGDKYIFLDVIMPAIDVINAEIELKARAIEKYNESSDPRVQFEAVTDRRHLRDYNISVKLGDYVNINEPTAEIDKDIRVVSKITNLQDKFDVTLELADTVSVANIVKQIIAQDAVQKAITNNKLNDVARQRLMWRTTSELTTMLDTLRAEMLLIMVEGGAYTTNIQVETSVDGDKNSFKTSSGTVQHDEYTENGGKWNVSEFSAVLPTDDEYYVYIKASRTSNAATIVYSLDKIAVEADAADYYFPFGIMSSVINDTRYFSSTKGYTAITGNNIRTGKIMSNDGLNFIDLDGNLFTIGNGSKSFKWDGNNIILKGGLVQNSGGDSAPITLFRGAYDPLEVYYKGDNVSFNGSSYILISEQPVTDVSPIDGEIWSIQVEKGDTGIDAKYISLTGEQIFTYGNDYDRTVDKESIDIVATENNFSAEPIDRIWEYEKDGIWTRIPNTFNSLIYTLRHDSALFGGENRVTIRYRVDDLYDQITVVKLYSAGSQLTLSVTSDFGDTLFPGNMETTLRAVVSYGDQIITATIDAYRFNWYRVSGDPEDDIAWRLREGIGVKQVNIDDSEVNVTAYFYFEID